MPASPTMSLNGVDITMSESVRNLGIDIDNKLIFADYYGIYCIQSTSKDV